MSNPKFLNIEKKVPYSVRLPQRLIDKLNAYAELNGNTTTNIINNVLAEFLADKDVLNDYLDTIGGVTAKIPYVIHQKKYIIKNYFKLIDNNSAETIIVNYGDGGIVETYFAELFEVKKIPNNLDIYDGDSYVANKNILKFNKNAIHSGIELFIYNITETIFADVDNFYSGDVDSFVNCLYCLYFEVTANDDVNVYLIDYLSAVNLLSASGNDEYKYLIIAAATELSDIDNVIESFKKDFADGEIKIAEKYLSDDDPTDNEYKKYSDEVNNLEKEIKSECKAKCDELVDIIANGYNSNNIIKFGSDIFSRLAIKEIDVASPEFDKLIDQLVTEKVDEIIDGKIDELLKTENRSIEKLSEIENINNKLNAKIDTINEIIESELNKNK